MNFKQNIYDLLFTGISERVKDENELFSFLPEACKAEPYYMAQVLKICLKLSAEKDISALTTTFYGFLLSYGKKEILSKQKFHSILIDGLVYFGPKELFEILEIVLNKNIGNGLGSFNQKLLRLVMETWSAEDLAAYATDHWYELRALTKYLHPRYDDDRSAVIKTFFYN